VSSCKSVPWAPKFQRRSVQISIPFFRVFGVFGG
jgi:hypothetical protein